MFAKLILRKVYVTVIQEQNMKKAMYRGIRDVRVEDVPEPNPGPREAKIKIKYCGICGSDLHEYLHGPFPQCVFGHEACGEVVEVGRETKGFQAGDRVLAFAKGAYSQFMICAPEQLLKVPPSMEWKRAAVVEPLAGAAYAIERGGIQPENTILIAGAGPVGLMMLIGLKAIGNKTIYITDVSESRRRKAQELGATGVANPLETKIPSWIKENTQGQGVDVAIEAVGIEATLKDCLTSARFRGKVIVQGIFTDRVPIHMLGFVARETTMIGTNSINPSLALNWIEHKGAQPEAIITRVIPLEQIVNAGFEILTGKNKTDIKILVEP
jgi:(R,R)-butanediol dehydrogenase/meso-butanediol dehydrogenase/diacetyl reductase